MIERSGVASRIRPSESSSTRKVKAGRSTESIRLAARSEIATGSMFGPEEALRHGYVDQIVAPDHLAEAVRDEALRLRGLDFPSYAATKARIHQRARAAIRTALDSEIRVATSL